MKGDTHSDDCDDTMGFVSAILGFVFTMLQMAFLMKYPKVCEAFTNLRKG